MDEARALYEEIILQHHRNPHNHGPLATATHRGDGRNPLCGDEIHLDIEIGPANRVERIQFQDKACAVCRASASILTQQLVGCTTEQAVQRAEQLVATVRGKAGLEGPADPELQAVAAVRRYPARATCAALPWETFIKAAR